LARSPAQHNSAHKQTGTSYFLNNNPYIELTILQSTVKKNEVKWVSEGGNSEIKQK
jgi:hypothetical protein